jgi:DNA (cytosine-5)-methyltransferase 1
MDFFNFFVLIMNMTNNKLITLDLFCGCGGMSLGFTNAGYSISAAFDNWEPAIEVYRKNFPDHEIYNVNLGNFDDYDMLSKFNPDVIIGGPPCQDFSHAGKRNENLGRGQLTLSFAHIVTNVKPKWFVMENVDRAAKSETVKKAIDLFHKAGYGLTSRILDASLCGVPQKRHRFFLIGELNGADDALGTIIESRLAKKPITVRDYLGDSLKIEHYYRHPRNYCRRGIFSIDEPAPTMRGVNRPLPKGYPGHAGDSAKNMDNIGPLTTIERSYIQTFPKDFIFVGTKTNTEQMIGNAVPVKLAEFIGKCLIDYINNKAESAHSLFAFA